MTNKEHTEVDMKKSQYDKAAKQYAKLQKEAKAIAKVMKPLHRRFMKLSENARCLGMKLLEIDDGSSDLWLSRYRLKDFNLCSDELTGRFFIGDAIMLCENLASTPFDTDMEGKHENE